MITSYEDAERYFGRKAVQNAWAISACAQILLSCQKLRRGAARHPARRGGPGGDILGGEGVSSRLLVDDVVHLLLAAAIPTGVWLRSPCPRAAGLRGIFGFPL